MFGQVIGRESAHLERRLGEKQIGHGDQHSIHATWRAAYEI